jgi:hypothetical protein
MIVPLAWAHDDYGRLLMKPLRHRAFFLGYRCPLHLLRAHCRSILIYGAGNIVLATNESLLETYSAASFDFELHSHLDCSQVGRSYVLHIHNYSSLTFLSSKMPFVLRKADTSAGPRLALVSLSWSVWVTINVHTWFDGTTISLSLFPLRCLSLPKKRKCYPRQRKSCCMSSTYGRRRRR